jgi:hypothetical protein
VESVTKSTKPQSVQPESVKDLYTGSLEDEPQNTLGCDIPLMGGIL